MRRIRVALALLTVVAGRPALAQQCADGSPPPCARQAASIARRVDPALDDRTWIVVPFNNVSRTPDVDYLRDASVNLLYLDLAKWSDVRVIDDARVADLIRQVPEARTSPLSLDAATAVARRAGAGRLVMGNVIKQGARTTLAVKVFDVRRGTVIRSPQQELLVQDSLMSVFGKLASSILGVAPPPGTEVASVGTSRVDAYQEYLTGLLALKRFDLDAARPHLEQAIKLDSNFALAHYRLGILIGWATPNDSTKARHAEIAARLAVTSGLPARERTLMKGYNEFQQGKNREACDTYGSLIKADSTDVEALYGLGECSYHDNIVVRSSADTAVRVFESNWNTVIRAFGRVLELDPTYHLAFQHILDVYTAQSRNGIDLRLCNAEMICQGIVAMLMNEGDSLRIVPIMSNDTARLRPARLDYTATDARRKNLVKAKQIATAWVDAAPDESRAHLELGHIHALLGELTEAQREFPKVKGKLTTTELTKHFNDRLDVGLKTGTTADLRRLIDSIVSVAPPTSGAATIAMMITGRLARFDSGFRVQIARQRSPAFIAEYRMAQSRMYLLGGTPGTDSVERRFLDSASSAGVWKTLPAMQIPSFFYTPGRPRVWPPLEYTPAGDHRSAAIVAISKGDTVRLRAETRAIDAELRARPLSVADSMVGLFVADLYLAARDSISALGAMRRMMDTTIGMTSLLATPNIMSGSSIAQFWPRALVLRADLEAAVGDRAKARSYYRQFIDLWSGADPEFQPFVNRVRGTLAGLPP